MAQNLGVATLTATFNRESTVERCFQSILNQTFKPLLIVFVDDGSTDGTVAKLENIQKDSPIPVEIISYATNAGPSFARNIGLDRITAVAAEKGISFVQIVDSDDELLPNKIAESVAAFGYDPNISIVYSDFYEVRDGKESYASRPPYSRQELERDCIISNNSMISLEALGSLRYDNKLRVAEDWDLWLRLTEGYSAYGVPLPLYRYHLSGDNTSETTDAKVYNASRTYVIKKMLARKNGV